MAAYVQAECADAVADDAWWDASEVFAAEGGGDGAPVAVAVAVLEGGMLAGGASWWQEGCSGCGGGSDGDEGAWSGGGSSAGDSGWGNGGGSEGGDSGGDGGSGAD